MPNRTDCFRETKSSLKFETHMGVITDHEMNDAYGDYMKMFETEKRAAAFAVLHPRARITKIFNYRAEDIMPGMPPMIKEGAVKYTVGWLVSLVPEPVRKDSKSKVVKLRR